MSSCTVKIIQYFRMTMCASIFLLIASSVERYFAVCRPHHYRQVGLTWIRLNIFRFQLIPWISDQRSSLERICLHSPLFWHGFLDEHYKVKEGPKHIPGEGCFNLALFYLIIPPLNMMNWNSPPHNLAKSQDSDFLLDSMRQKL